MLRTDSSESYILQFQAAQYTFLAHVRILDTREPQAKCSRLMQQIVGQMTIRKSQ